MLIPRSVSHHRPGVRDDQPFQYDTNDWFSIENESLLLCSLAVISLRITWALQDAMGHTTSCRRISQRTHTSACGIPAVSNASYLALAKVNESLAVLACSLERSNNLLFYFAMYCSFTH